MPEVSVGQQFVGNLPYQVSDEDLRHLFGQAGTVKNVTIVTDRQTGRPRGFGFVEMATDQEAVQAARMFDGYYLEGRTLRVNPAEAREPREFKPGRRGQERTGRRAA